AIPRLFDEFDRLAAATAGREVKGSLPASPESVFRYSLLAPDADVAAEATAYRPAFSPRASLTQRKPVDPELFAAEKGSPLTSRETEILAERVTAARRWLDTYAPESARIVVRTDALPPTVAELADAQRDYLGALGAAVEARPPDGGTAWQATIFAVAADRGLPNGRAFAPIYAAFLGRPKGPRAGWLLAGLQPGFVIERLRAASGQTEASA